MQHLLLYFNCVPVVLWVNCYVSLPLSAGLVCDCSISWSYSLAFCNHLVRGKVSWLLYFKSIFLLLCGCLGPGLCLVVPYVGLWSVIVAFPGHTHYLYCF